MIPNETTSNFKVVGLFRCCLIITLVSAPLPESLLNRLQGALTVVFSFRLLCQKYRMYALVLKIGDLSVRARVRACVCV